MATKYCFVLSCLNNSKKNPDKHYINVPQNKYIREQWCIAVDRPILSIKPKSPAYCCSDHFNVDDFKEFDVNASVKAKLKPGIIPFKHKLQYWPTYAECQETINPNDRLKSMMDIQEPAQEFRCLASKSASQTVSDDDEMVLNYSDSEDDHSCKLSKNDDLKEDLDLLEKGNQMAADDDFPDKTSNSEISNDNPNDVDVEKSDVFQSKMEDDDVEKLSLLDRFLSSEVVENCKQSATDLIGDELVDELIDETASEVIDENALLDEITNDLDNNEEELDEQSSMGDDLTDIETKDDVFTTELTSSKSSDEKVPDSDQNEVDDKREIVVGNCEAEAIPSAEIESMEVDQDNATNSPLPPPPNPSCEMETENSDLREAAIDESKTESSGNIPKFDEDQDNNLLEEMVDSPRSSEHESMTSDLLEKDDTVTGDSNEDQQLILESSNENSNMSEGAAMPEIDLEEFKHDVELQIMDEACDIVESSNQDQDIKDESALDKHKEEVADEPSLKVKEEELTADERIDEILPENLKATPIEDFPTEDTVEEVSQPIETPCKRKSSVDIDEPETKKQRVEDVSANTENVLPAENSISAISDIADANENDAIASKAAGDAIEKETSENVKEDDDDVLIVCEMKQPEKLTDADSSASTEIQQPVEKAKILILDTQAIAMNDATASKATSESDAVPEKDSEISSSQGEMTIEKEVIIEKEVTIEKLPETTVTEKIVETKSKTETPLTLDPVPQKTLFPTAFSLNFVRKFNKNFDKMTRNDLEELLIQKCVEVIVHKSEYADMRNKIEKQENKLLSYSAKYQELSKQYRDLEMVHQRVVKDLEIKNQSVVTPVKITRAVGLQVSLPRKEIALQRTPQSVASNMQAIAQQNKAAAAAAAMARNRRSLPLQRPNDPNANLQQQQMHQQQMIRQNMAMARKPDLQAQQRNQFHMQQQQQQQNQQNNMLKQQLIQNNNPNNIRQQVNIRKPPTQFSPTTASQLQNASPKTPGSADRPRVPPVILKKMTPTRMVSINNTASNSTAVYSSQTKLPSTAATRSPAATTTTSMNNLIDLTDEEDNRRVTQNGTHPPALVAIPNNQGNKTVIGQGKVNFVTLKPGTPQAQLQMVQQNRLANMQKVGGTYVPIAPKSNGTTGQIVQLRKQQPATTLTPVQRRQHPAPLPYPNNQPTNPYWKLIPPRPIIRINNIESGIVISWTMDEMTDKHAEVASYQIYAYQETSAAPSPETWRHVGDVKAMLLPMAVTLTQFQEGQRYHFAVRAVDEHSRYGIFSLPKTWT